MAAKAKKSTALPIYVLNGPNLNLLGVREPHIYGHTTLADVGKMCAAEAKSNGFATVFRQTNYEGELVTWIQEARTKASALILNAGAYTHTSVAVHDALLALTIPIVEVHLSNPHARDSFRHHSYVSSIAKRSIAGFGAQSYVLAIRGVATILKDGK